MIASFTDHARKKEEKRNHDQLVDYFCKNITQTSAWVLLLSITNNVKQKTFSNEYAQEIVKILCTEYGIRASAIQYCRSFSSAPSLLERTKASNVIQLTFKKVCHTTNNERLMYELRTAIQDKTIEYRQVLDLVITIIENYPDTEKHLQS
jgi:hypothetical protein